ncbi:MAG: hypothetical protein RLZZ623_2490 [Actinomycetota bacterium]|jgi:Flp pilus assembly protein TadB
MSDLLLPTAVRTQSAIIRLRHSASAHLRQAWAERNDETGIDEAVTKMIWLAVGIGVAVAATAFFIGVFNTAQANVPDPVAPTP